MCVASEAGRNLFLCLSTSTADQGDGLRMASREEILGLLQRIARPPDVLEEEWHELLLLEAPSILGLAMPGADVLEEEVLSTDNAWARGLPLH